MQYSDYHVHTHLSNCGAHEATVPSYLALCGEENVATIGFSNHMWDEKIPGASDWYKNQTTDHVFSIREEIPADTGNVKVYIGCEIDISRYFTVGMSRETRDRFDYVLIPTTHLHMKDFTISREVTDLATVRFLIRKRMETALAAEVASGLAHPMIPLGFYDRVDELLGGYSDTELLTIFSEVADAGLSVELNASGLLWNSSKMRKENGWPYQYLRVFSLAREAGCVFHLGSDAHCGEAFRCHEKLAEFGKACGITEYADLVEIHRRLYKKK